MAALPPEAPASAPAPAPAETLVPRDFVPCAESAHALYQLTLDDFHGPLDLLLFLIRRHKIDIFDIPIAFICERYLATLRDCAGLSLDVAAEFMFMASELLHIKSRLLLPKPPGEAAEEEEEEDPRAALVRRLLEYKRFQEAAATLAARDRLGREIFARPPQAEAATAPGRRLREVDVLVLVHALSTVLKRGQPDLRHQVTVEPVSVRRRMAALVALLGGAAAVPFAQLIDAQDGRLGIIVTFLALLELTKMKLLRVYASDNDVLYLRPRFESAAAGAAALDAAGAAEGADIDAQFT